VQACHQGPDAAFGQHARFGGLGGGVVLGARPGARGVATRRGGQRRRGRQGGTGPITEAGAGAGGDVCAWDGGFLPTELEWQHAATAGNESRKYAWVGDTLDSDHALYGACGHGVSTACDLSSILEVGSKPAGAGKWGHLDLIGSVWEWILDSPSGEFPAAQPCDDCASLGVSSYRSIRGGSWPEDESYMPSATRTSDPATDGWYNIGIRCAHAP